MIILLFSGPLDKHFIISVSDGKSAYIILADSINGKIPPQNKQILGTFYSTSGVSGNLYSGTINNFVGAKPDFNTAGASDIIVSNPTDSVAGQGVQQVRAIRESSIKFTNTCRAVTLEDHRNMAKLVPGVLGSYARIVESNQSIEIFITAETRGSSSKFTN